MTMVSALVLVFLANMLVLTSAAEFVRDLEISEGAPVGTKIGSIGDEVPLDSGPPYLIVPVGIAVDTDLAIDQNTGEIRTKVPLDRETRASYSLVAIPMSGDNVRVVVTVLDENDNAPTFPSPTMNIEFPENTPRDVKRTLHPARDLDLDIFNTQKYNIVSGNTENVFRLSSHRERDGVLYLDLQISGFLDRETTPFYSLVIEALDGGTPPLRGEMTVNITIQDVNDNPPVFNQSRYFAKILENSTVGTSVLEVLATDADAEENGEIEYSINRRQSDKDNMFRIDSSSGKIFVNKPLDFETKELHELVIVAKDHGLQPLEATAFVSVRVINVNDNQPTINVIFLSDDATPKISESAQPGEFVARISVHDPDSKTDYSNVNVTLSGGEGHFGLTTRDNSIYLVIVALPLDRELQPNYTLDVVATDTGTPPLHASRTINLHIADINDNAPEFDQNIYYADVMEVADPGTSVIWVVATDKDEGNNSVITYSLVNQPENHSGWFHIDSRSGLVTTQTHVDCETDPLPRLTVVATDNGFPPLSSSTIVLVTVHDVNDNEPIFDHSFYNVTVAENEPEGRCIIKVSATDPDCGVNAIVNYTLGDGFEKITEFKIKSDTGEVCISSQLDYETRNDYEFSVTATDRGGLSTMAILRIQITDVNDNRPVFYPSEYNVSLRENGASSSAATPVVVVAATDADSGKFGTISYKIVAGNERGLFRIEKSTGEIFVNRPNLLSTRGQPYHKLNISAVDGGNLRTSRDAQVFISVIDSAQRPPIFDQSRYTFSVSENVRKNTVVGSIRASILDGVDKSAIRYTIYSGDPEGYFTINPATGAIITSSNLDHEIKSSVLLNIQASSGDPPVYSHTQVNIDIEDVNDNAPEFEFTTVRISVPENVEVGTTIYSAHASDKDSGQNGVVGYRISNNPGDLFRIHPEKGDLTIGKPLDFETSQRHTIVVAASDMGSPVLSTNLTIFVEIQDVNDNPPVFERDEYSLSVSESSPINTQILQLIAVDADTGNNARLTYKISNASSLDQEIFGVQPNSGWLYLKSTLDRETKDKYALTVSATDNGTPAQMAMTSVLIEVSDANDNDPAFVSREYEFSVEENLQRGAFVGAVLATDADAGVNAALRYRLIPGNSSFQINQLTGEITTKEPLDREQKQIHDLVVEARDQGTPSRTSRVIVKITVLDVNDNTPEIIDPKEDVISVREEQPPGTEVVRVKAVDADSGNNASITYSIINNRDSDDHSAFTIDPYSGVIRTKLILDHEEKTIYRLAIKATDGGHPPKQSIRILRVEVLDLNDNRPTFTSSSLVFQIPEDVPVGHIVGSIAASEPFHENSISGSGGYITYTLTSMSVDRISDAFDIDRSIGSLIVARQLDRESQSEYKLEVRALDTSALNNPQSSAITVRVDIVDVNDNAPRWPQDPIIIPISENTEIGASVYNFTATDADSGGNGDLRYSLENKMFSIDSLTGSLTLLSNLDFESIQEYTIVITATDQPQNVSQKLSTSVTGRIIVTDFNDNAPKFVLPATSKVYINEATIVGITILRILAVDIDSGDNGRVTYIISAGNENGLFSLGYDTGVLTLAKPVLSDRKSYFLNVTANDHGTPTKKSTIELELFFQGSFSNSPKRLDNQYAASVPEDISVGTVITRVRTQSSPAKSGNDITFLIPPGIDDETFEILSPSGQVRTLKLLDRETKDSYMIPVYVNDSVHLSTLFDTTVLAIEVTDVNDNAPVFQPGSCYRLSVPENSDIDIIHTVKAQDSDSGPNGDILYSITGGNTGNKFSIDVKSGELTARPLDMEGQSKYSLVLTARDRGAPTLQSSCNLTIYVEDQNDNDPKFDLSKYSTAISENAAIDTSVLTVHASDADTGMNGKIIYSLANESHWLFRIDNKTGIITTAGSFDRETQNVYNFLVVATDRGKYNARSQSVPVSVEILDVNDNNPVFTRYPFSEKVVPYIQPGQMILKVIANDIDEGSNAEIVYSIVNDGSDEKFRINPNTGILTTTQSLASNKGRVIYLNILATDKGNPPRSSTGLVEIMVGDLPDGSPFLTFQNETYNISIIENAEKFSNVVQVTAVRSDGRRQEITYSIGSGNEDNIFVINSNNGIIQLRDPTHLDYELHKEILLIVEAKTKGIPNLHGYCKVLIQITDENDNAPKFTQQQYTANVLEGNTKSEFVLQVSAFDADEGANSRVLYHIVDGNHDNAFKIEPAFSGTLKTNIVLDREIRDLYRLTVIATDEGIPQMTGTTRIRIDVVDVNDNQPTFPPHSIITVREDMAVGTVLTTVTANDVDTFPPLKYEFSKDNRRKDMEYFSIDRYSGKVVLQKNLDYELWKECQIGIVATDTAHLARTTLTVKVIDVNDNPPVFAQSSYIAFLPDGDAGILTDIATVDASDLDSDDNSRIKFSIVNQTPGFFVGKYDGILRTNLSKISSPWGDILLTIKATDEGNPPLHSFVPVRIRTNITIGSGMEYSHAMDYRINLLENTTRGATIIHLAKSSNVQNALYKIIDGNNDRLFEISPPSGALFLVEHLDRELQDTYTLRISVGNTNWPAFHILINVEDSNDNAPIFKSADYEKTISESSLVGSEVETIVCTDADLEHSPNSDIVYDITSGNDLGNFRLHHKTGVLYVNKTLDYDQGETEYNIVIRACDMGIPSLCTLNTFMVILQDENDNRPVFPVSEYLAFVGENEPVGTVILTVHATDLDKGPFGSVNYSITSTSPTDNSWKLFQIDSSTGLITTSTVFDYEQRNRYAFTTRATDLGGKYCSVKVRIEIEGKDEFHPQFTERTYKLTLPSSTVLPVGYIVGHVTATDRDKGPDGRIVYQLNTQHQYFKVNRTTGNILIKKKLDYAEFTSSGGVISLVITASSGRQGSLNNMTVVEIILDPLADAGDNLAINLEKKGVTVVGDGIADWALGLLISLLLLIMIFGAVFVFLHFRNKRNKQMVKPNLNSETVSSANNYVDPSAFDTIPIRAGVGPLQNNQFAPPKYDEIPPYGPPASTNSGAATTSEISGSEQSGSSGRGSAEDDGEDEEIRMINEGPLQRDSGIHRQNDEEDNLSDMSVRNTQEYLARLGIINNNSTSRICQDPRASTSKDNALHHQSVPLDSLNIFDEDGNENDITNLIYAKLNDVKGIDRAVSTNDCTGVSSTNIGVAMDHVMGMSGYGDHPIVTHHQPSMNGSLSSIVHSEEELAGSYNWDYLLDWGPQYQPLAHVFSEIARLKDDTTSVHSGASGNSSIKSSVAYGKSVPPPLITSVAPRSIAMPVLNSRGGPSHHNQMMMLPRSPINHDASGATFSTSTAMSPSFSPSLSPLATKSPSVSPLVAPGISTSHHVMSRQPLPRNTSLVDTELRI